MRTDNNKARAVADILEKIYPDAVCSLDYDKDPWKLLVMARLSAQCTDKRVNIVSRDLFKAFPDAESMADAPIEKIEALIKSCGLYHTKARSIKEASDKICREYGGRIPDTMEELLSLPGVGRKIANLILGDIYKKGGIVSDTHLIRICGRLGFYPNTLKDPYKIEKIMTPLIDLEKQSDFCHRIVQFGRDTCTAKNPDCSNCPLSNLCRYKAGK